MPLFLVTGNVTRGYYMSSANETTSTTRLVEAKDATWAQVYFTQHFESQQVEYSTHVAVSDVEAHGVIT